MGLAVGGEREPQRLLGQVLPTEPVTAMILACERARAARARSRKRLEHIVDDQQRRVGGKARRVARARRRRGRRRPSARPRRSHGRRGCRPGWRRRHRPCRACGCRWKCRARRPAARRISPRAWPRPWRRRSTARSCHLALQGRGDRVVVGERQHAVADDLAGLVALAGDQQHVACFAARRCRRGWPAARSPISVAPGAAARMAARIAAGCSLRGLSSVTMTRSAFSAAMRPMIGRLPASRSPPAPNTTTSLPLA